MTNLNDLAARVEKMLCPWCATNGNLVEVESTINGWKHIRCDYCGAQGPYALYAGNTDPVEAWNSRNDGCLEARFCAITEAAFRLEAAKEQSAVKILDGLLDDLMRDAPLTAAALRACSQQGENGNG